MYGAPWSGKHGLDTNVAVPLKGICILERGSENRIMPISSDEALPMLLHQSQPPLEKCLQNTFNQLVSDLAGIVPLWRMECTKDPAAATIAHEAMSL